MQILADGRFTLGPGSGERPNEHVLGEGWPGAHMRQERLVEAIEIIRKLLTGEMVTHEGEQFSVDTAKVWDVPEQGLDIGVAVSGEKEIEQFAELADHLIAVQPDRCWRSCEHCRAPAGARTPALLLL